MDKRPASPASPSRTRSGSASGTDRDAPLFAWGDALRAARARRRLLRRRGVALAVGGVLLAATAVAPPDPRLVWNASASMPVGLYRVSPGVPPTRGDAVVARLPATMRSLAASRRYLAAGVPLVKRVAAVAGDEICALGNTIYRDGKPVAWRRAFDANGRMMPWWEGCHILRDAQILLLTDAPDSFDGRYFGITARDDIIGKAQLLWAR